MNSKKFRDIFSNPSSDLMKQEWWDSIKDIPKHRIIPTVLAMS